MEFKCSPYTVLLFFGVIGIFIFCTGNVSAQCKGDFSYQFVSSDKNSNSGRIELSVANPAGGTYTFKVYEMNGTVVLVQSKQASNPQTITFDNLKPATYFIKVEWGDSCYQTLGGQHGILITSKEQER